MREAAEQHTTSAASGSPGSSGAYEVRTASSDSDLQQILDLQAANLPAALDDAERRAEGFVTLRHDLALLREMNSPWPHVVASPRGTDEVVAYALVMPLEFRGRFPILDPMFEELDRLAGAGARLHGKRWYFMGQLCVAKAHRGRGLVEAMYAKHRELMRRDFDMMITEIDASNTRSVRVHEKAGCTPLHAYRGAGREWVIVGMDLRAP